MVVHVPAWGSKLTSWYLQKDAADLNRLFVPPTAWSGSAGSEHEVKAELTRDVREKLGFEWADDEAKE
jgi:hypothetical protein